MSVYEDMLKNGAKPEDFLGRTFKFYAVNGFNFWESLNKSKSDLKIWIVKILIPLEDAAVVFESNEKTTPHLSVGAYYVKNHYK